MAALVSVIVAVIIPSVLEARVFKSATEIPPVTIIFSLPNPATAVADAV